MSSSSLSATPGEHSNKRQSLSTIESSVTRLLVSTKHLLESLTQWARREADDRFVSDAYVKLGNDFRAATRAFSHAGVDISDIGDVPHALRIILEAALSEPPTQEHLDKFLPNIRNIIVNLLQNLKSKQVKAKNLSQERQLKSKSELETGSFGSSRSKMHSRDSIEDSTLKESENSQNRNSSDALVQLQKGNSLQRRASKRFSAYQYAKLTNNSPNTDLSKLIPSDNMVGGKTSRFAPPRTEVNQKEAYPNSEKSINIFLKIGNKTKKVSIKPPVSFASLRLLFVEKFAYSPGSSSFPEIYILDPTSNVSYELEEHHLTVDVKEGTLLSLNEPSSQNVHLQKLDEKLLALTSKFDKLPTSITEDVRHVVKSIEVQPNYNVESSTKVAQKSTDDSELKLLMKEFNIIQHELRIIRQVQASTKENVSKNISAVLNKVKMFRENGLDVSKSSNRAYMDSCSAKLSEGSDVLLTKVDDLQDIMEALRKDVAQRGVRVGEKQLKHTYKEIQEAKSDLRDMIDYIKREKVQWKKIWESELDKVCEEQQFFNLQDDLTQDLEEDLTKIEETYGLIEQCSLEQEKQNAYKRNKFVAQLYIPEPGESIHVIKDEVLSEVSALTPDHEKRLKAISKAEKIREKERQMMKLNKFQEELGDFVEDNKLKKSGGIDEIERIRKMKDNNNLKSSFGVI